MMPGAFIGGFPFQPGYGVVSGLYAHYVADRSGYAEGATVSSVADLSGNDKTLSTIQGTVTYVANQINGRGVIRAGTSGILEAASFFDETIAANATIIGVFRINGADANLMWDSTSGFWFNTGTVSPQSTKIQQMGGGVLRDYAGGTHFLFVMKFGTATSPYLEPRNIASMNWRSEYRAGSAFAGSTAGNTLQIPRSGLMEFSELLFYSRHLTWTEIFGITDRMKINPVSNLPGVVLPIGNSTFTAQSNYLPAQLTSISPGVFGFGNDSGMIANTKNQTTEIMELVSYFRNRGKKVILVVHPGHNDYYGQSTNPTTNTVIRHLNGVDGTTLYSSARTAGAKVLLVTPSCWNGGSGGPGGRDATTESYRVALRAWILDHAVQDGYADGVSDYGASAEFGVWTADVNAPDEGTSIADYPTLWADQVHQTAAGETRKAELIAPDIISMWDAY